MGKKVFDNMGWARWPGVEKGEPSRVSIGGANIGISVFGQNPELATQAALCMTQRKYQDAEAITEWNDTAAVFPCPSTVLRI